MGVLCRSERAETLVEGSRSGGRISVVFLQDDKHTGKVKQLAIIH